MIEGDRSAANDGRPVAYQGAPIYCPSCKSEGRIINIIPYLPMALCGGKQVALEGDWCACKCEPPPPLIASRDDMFMTMDAQELAQMGYAPDGKLLEKNPKVQDEVFDRYFRFVDENGEPVSEIRVHLIDVNAQTKLVRTDGNGRTPLMSGREGQRIGVRLTASGRQ
ncbi:PAAR domain-containing protein [Paraburkholderia sp. FT54]|uniref:PAAR domain-containing protein n=1 Tax=Paraburkholderia sp. FT54 TaxID=3074437 RepID=UPI0028777569|nr:PAAR domain-containing protein [Paraburkholderia sp. FT54]WNC89335.1 PAAR domain-containing protein [Paraburkholderia sp. FT54]